MSEFDNHRILIIDDDARIHEDFRKILGDKAPQTEYDEIESSLFNEEKKLSISYELDSAYQGKEGYEKVIRANSENRPYAMAFVDMRMPPGWDGLETIKHIWQADAQIQLVMCTAYSDYSWNEVLYHLGASDRLIILKKPFDMVEVQQIATALTTKWTLSCESLSRLKRAQDSEEKYRTVVDSVEDAIMTLDKSGKILFVNHNPWHMINLAIGENYYLGINKEHRARVIKSVSEVFEKGEKQNIEYSTQALDKSAVWAEARISPCYKNTEVVAATLVASDISARKALDWQMRHDELTGLPNRTHFVSHVEACVSDINSVQKYAMLFIDLDHFNLINDCFGHEIGDKLLIKISQLLMERINEQEMLARLGGDEFAILKFIDNDNDNNNSKIKTYIESLNELLKQPLTIDGFDLYSSASIGVVLVDGAKDAVSSLFRDADAALHHAKSKGRNRYEYFDQTMHDVISRRMSLSNSLRKAINADEFEVCFQPFTSLAEARVTGFEALVRWNHPEKGIILPDEFIPVAEETGLIFDITRKVLQIVCRQLKSWEDLGQADVKVAVNCSAREFNEQNLQKVIAEIITETSANINRLELELTEGSIMHNVEDAIKNMRTLTQMGLKISIDDFGTGYSSFSYIKQFSIDKLKIDRAFIKDTPQDQDDVAIVEAIIAMAQRLKIKVVAEGVETIEQLEYLTKVRCDVIQGFLLGEPMSAEEVTRRLQQNDWPNQHLLTQTTI